LEILITSYNYSQIRDEIAVDYLIMGPGLGISSDSQAKANHLISIAEKKGLYCSNFST
jgi:hypothetical protein